jgi:hypothetical protein
MDIPKLKLGKASQRPPTPSNTKKEPKKIKKKSILEDMEVYAETRSEMISINSRKISSRKVSSENQPSS